jgi:hypothetical protein
MFCSGSPFSGSNTCPQTAQVYFSNKSKNLRIFFKSIQNNVER